MQASYSDLLAIARRHARLAHEAEDLVQDALLAGLTAGRADLSDPANRRWLAGVIRNLSRLNARSAVRRKAREAGHVPAVHQADAGAEDRRALFGWVRTLAPSLRGVAALALTGHTRAEMRAALGLPDTALRQRLSALKRAARADAVSAPGFVSLLDGLPHGKLRRQLPVMLVRRGAAFGTYDPDGNLLMFRTSALTNPRPAATEGQDACDGRARLAKDGPHDPQTA